MVRGLRIGGGRGSGGTLSPAHALNAVPQPLASSAKQGPLTDTQGPVDHGRHGGRSAKPPPVSSVVARSMADQCWPLHVPVWEAAGWMVGPCNVGCVMPASAKPGTPAIAPISAMLEMNPAMTDFI